MTNPIVARLDHLVLGARTLGDGVAWVAEKFGVAPQPGGRHLPMGTYNALLRLDGKRYLEILAIDPDGDVPFQARWFGMDDVHVRQAIADEPKLLNWIARCNDIDAAAGIDPRIGPVHPMTRGDFHWRITIPTDGACAENGLLPTLLQWGVPMHPTERLPDQNCRLLKLAGAHPAPEKLLTVLRQLDLTGEIELAKAETAQLWADIETPGGLVRLSGVGV